MDISKLSLIGLGLVAVACGEQAPPPPPPGTAAAVQACLNAHQYEFTDSMLAACAYRHSEDMQAHSTYLDGGAAFRFSCASDDCEALSFDGTLTNRTSLIVFTSLTLSARFGESQSNVFLHSSGSVFIEPGETYEFSVPRRSFVRVPTRADIPLEGGDASWSWNLERARGFRLLTPVDADEQPWLFDPPVSDP